MSRSIRVVLAVLALAAVVLTTASAETVKSCGAAKSSSGCKAGGVKIVEKRDGKTVKTIGTCDKEVAALHEKYEKQFVAIHEKHEAKIVELAEKIGTLEREIDEIVKAELPDLGKLESKLEKISDLRFERTKLRFRMHKDARAVVDEADRAALDKHFAMGVGCCGGAGMQATYHPDRAEGKFEMKSCCPAGKAPHCSGKADMKSCCPGHKGHASMSSPRVMFVGEKDGHAEVQILDDVHGMLGCAPGKPGETRIEVLLDEEEDGVRMVKVLVDGEHGEGEHLEFMLDDENLDGDVHRIMKKIQATPGCDVEDLGGDGRQIIKRVYKVPGGESDDLIWSEIGGSVGPF